MFLLKNKLLVGATAFICALLVTYLIVGNPRGSCRTSLTQVLNDPLAVALLPTEQPLPREIAEYGDQLFRFLNMLYSERALFETEGVLGEGSNPEKFVFDLNMELEFRKWNKKHFTPDGDAEKKKALMEGFHAVYLGNLKRAAIGGESDKKRFLIRTEAIKTLFAEENKNLANVFCLDGELKAL